LTRLITLLATAALAATILFRSPSDFRMAVCIIVSVAAVTIVIRSMFRGKLVWALPFLGVLAIFTPFHQTQFSYLISSILDMATLALLAASPMITGKSTSRGGLKHPVTKAVIHRH
jgi:hypothetical protein